MSSGSSGQQHHAPHEIGNSSTIPDDDSVYRRLSDSGPSMITTDAATCQRRPTSGAFKPDEGGVSVYRESRLHAAGLTAADLVRAPQNRVVGLGVGDVRSVSPLDVHDDPWPAGIAEPEHPRNAAHALITGWDGLTRNERRDRQVALTRLPSFRFEPL